MYVYVCVHYYACMWKHYFKNQVFVPVVLSSVFSRSCGGNDVQFVCARVCFHDVF